jgi:hypothetical protein
LLAGNWASCFGVGAMAFQTYVAVIALGHKFTVPILSVKFFAYGGPFFESLGVARWCRVWARAFGSVLEWCLRVEGAVVL